MNGTSFVPHSIEFMSDLDFNVGAFKVDEDIADFRKELD